MVMIDELIRKYIDELWIKKTEVDNREESPRILLERAGYQMALYYMRRFEMDYDRIKEQEVERLWDDYVQKTESIVEEV